MGRRAKPKKSKAEAERLLARKPRPAESARVRDLAKRLAESLEREKAKDRALSEALERETSTSEILRVISNSPTDVQPVFDAILERALRLCAAVNGLIFRLEGGLLSPVAHAGFRSPEWAALADGIAPQPPTRDLLVGFAVLEGHVIHVPDVEAEDRFPYAVRMARTMGIRSLLGVPMLREGVAVGAMALTKAEPAGFDESQIALLKTFAEQAVIAIENVRLFTELGARNRDLSEALARQTATSEVLRVISRSQTDVQPVFAAILESAVRLCAADLGGICRVEDGRLALIAFNPSTPEFWAVLRENYPRPVDTTSLTGRAAVERRVVHVADIDDPGAPAGLTPVGKGLGFRAQLSVPILRDGQPIGVFALQRRAPGPFSDAQIELVQTFADQAVIAIENARLLSELQEKNGALTDAHAQMSEALEQQTATGEILKVIASSPTDTRPVFEAIIESAARLCSVDDGWIVLAEGDALRAVAARGQLLAQMPVYNARRVLVSRETTIGRAILDRATLHVADLAGESEIEYPEARALQRVFGHRSQLVIPLLREGAAIGTILLARFEVRPFSERQVELLKTFADQAVIAIENVRLFAELQARTQELTRSVEQLTALGDVGRAVSSSLDLDTVLTTIVGRAVQLSGTDGGTIFEYDEGAEEFSPRATLNADESQSALLRATRLRRGEGAVGQMAVTREPLQIPDIAAEGAYDSRLRGALLQAGTRAVLAVPLLHEERIVGGLVVTRRTPGAFTTEIVEILGTFATQSALAIENARLFREIERKSRELEVASQHKSEFLANMSHELRTPLNAIIGYSELLEEEAADVDGGRLVPDLQKIATAAKHQLSLINDILDLSKVEAGRMELEVTDFDLPSAVDNALTLVRERATRRGITLVRAIHDRVGAIQADERKVKQVLLNLLSNALKFTPEGGRIDVQASANENMVELSVADTGVGIAPDDQEAVFEEFRQVGTADKKVEGTGLGLALSRKFIELHGGRIWVQSRIGHGSTFTFTLPVRREG